VWGTKLSEKKNFVKQEIVVGMGVRRRRLLSGVYKETAASTNVSKGGLKKIARNLVDQRKDKNMDYGGGKRETEDIYSIAGKKKKGKDHGKKSCHGKKGKFYEEETHSYFKGGGGGTVYLLTNLSGAFTNGGDKRTYGGKRYKFVGRKSSLGELSSTMARKKKTRISNPSRKKGGNLNIL